MTELTEMSSDGMTSDDFLTILTYLKTYGETNNRRDVKLTDVRLRDIRKYGRRIDVSDDVRRN